MFEELLVCLGEIYAGVEQKITELKDLLFPAEEPETPLLYL